MKVTELTTDELKKLIKEAVDEKFREILFDPDDRLELRDEVKQKLKASIASKKRISLEEVKKRVRIM
jgi:hypothetical protein